MRDEGCRKLKSPVTEFSLKRDVSSELAHHSLHPQNSSDLSVSID